MAARGIIQRVLMRLAVYRIIYRAMDIALGLRVRCMCNPKKHIRLRLLTASMQAVFVIRLESMIFVVSMNSSHEMARSHSV